MKSYPTRSKNLYSSGVVVTSKRWFNLLAKICLKNREKEAKEKVLGKVKAVNEELLAKAEGSVIGENN